MCLLYAREPTSSETLLSISARSGLNCWTAEIIIVSHRAPIVGTCFPAQAWQEKGVISKASFVQELLANAILSAPGLERPFLHRSPRRFRLPLGAHSW